MFFFFLKHFCERKSFIEMQKPYLQFLQILCLLRNSHNTHTLSMSALNKHNKSQPQINKTKVSENTGMCALCVRLWVCMHVSLKVIETSCVAFACLLCQDLYVCVCVSVCVCMRAYMFIRFKTYMLTNNFTNIRS